MPDSSRFFDAQSQLISTWECQPMGLGSSVSIREPNREVRAGHILPRPFEPEDEVSFTAANKPKPLMCNQHLSTSGKGILPVILHGQDAPATEFSQ